MHLNQRGKETRTISSLWDDVRGRSVGISGWNQQQNSRWVTLAGVCAVSQHYSQLSNKLRAERDTHPSRLPQTGRCPDVWWAAATPAGSPTRLWFWRTGRWGEAYLCGTARSSGSTARQPWLDRSWGEICCNFTATSIRDSVGMSRALTRVVLHQLLEGLKLCSGGDVVASIVQFANFIVLDVVSFDVIPVLNGEWVGPWKKGVIEVRLPNK